MKNCKSKIHQGIRLLVVLFSCMMVQSGMAQRRVWPVRLASYNICACKSMDKVTDAYRTGQILKSLGADVIAVEEVDSCAERTGKVDQVAYLSKVTGMHANFIHNIDFQGGAYGVMILSKEKPLSIRRIHLPGVEPRGMVVCEFQDFVYACTHLCDCNEENRLASADIILQESRKWKKPFFVAGDLNDTPESATLQNLKKEMTVLSDEKFTFPADKPEMCIDYIATTQKDAKAVASEIVDEKVVSDHRPIWVDVEW